jgi:para-nitrobenzyl esterase
MFASLRKGMPPARPWEEADYKLAAMMSSYWANFMSTGDPNGSGLPVWPASNVDFGWMDLGAKPVGHSGVTSPLDRMLLDYIKQNPLLPQD